MAGEVYYPLPFPLPRQVKVLPQSPAPAATDNPPFGGARAAAQRAALVASWYDIPSYPAISKQSLKDFYNPQWSIPDSPPLVGLSQLRQTQLVLQCYQALQYSILSRVEYNPLLLPSVDAPPRWQLPRLLSSLIDTHVRYQAEAFKLPRSPQGRPTFFYGPGAEVRRLGSIAFQPDAFFIGYPKRKVGFQGANRFVALGGLGAKPYLIMILNQGRQIMEKHPRGDAVDITVTVYDPSANVNLPSVLLTPESTVLTITNPEGLTVADDVPMVESSRGTLVYTYQIPTDALLGVYTAQPHCIHFGRSAIGFPAVVFVVAEHS